MPLPNMPFYNQSDFVASCSARSKKKIQSGAGYFRLQLLDMRLGRDWILSTTLFPSFHMALSGNKQHEITVNPMLRTKTSSSDDIRAVYVSPHYLTPYMPYYGETSDIFLGLFSIPNKDLAKEILKFLTDLSSATLQADLTTSLMFTDLIRSGANSLLGLKEARQRLAWKGQVGGSADLFSVIHVVGPPELTKHARDLSIGKDYRLQVGGERVENVDYFVFAVRVADSHTEWYLYPDIKPYYDAWRIAAFQLSEAESDRSIYNKFLENLVSALYKSNMLVEMHVNQIIEQLSTKLNEIESLGTKIYRGDDIISPNIDADSVDEDEFADLEFDIVS